jgi:hypothetical protein
VSEAGAAGARAAAAASLTFARHCVSTRGGAGGRDDIGSSSRARGDFAVWRTDGLELGGADDGWSRLLAPHRGIASSSRERRRGDGALVNADRLNRAAIGCSARFAAERPPTHVLDRRPASPRPACASSSLAAARSWSGRDRCRRPHRELASDLEPGRYAFVFWPPSAFFARVELEVELEEALPRPLLVSPYGCASYRGSSVDELSSSSRPHAPGRASRGDRDPSPQTTSSHAEDDERSRPRRPAIGQQTGLSARSAAEKGRPTTRARSSTSQR